MSQKNNEKLKSIATLIIGIIFALIISEIILQILDFPLRPNSGWLSCEKINPEECNSMGFRGREIAYSDDDFVVILLGDSEVYAPSIPYKQIPERRLEHFLQNYRDNVKVFTIADMGYGHDQQYLALKKYFEKHRADLVLHMFTSRNDVEDNIFPTSGYNNTIKPTFWLEKGELRGPSEGWLEPIGPRMKFPLLWILYAGKAMGESRLEKWKKEIIPPHYQGLTHYEGEIDYTWQEQWNSNPQQGFKSLEHELVGQSGNELTPRSELRTYGINLTRKLLSKIQQLVETHNGHFIIFKEERTWEIQGPDKEQVYFFQGKYYKLSMSQYHENVRDIFNGFEYYRVPMNLDNYTVSSKDYHLNQMAIDRLMKELSFVISKKEYFREK